MMDTTQTPASNEPWEPLPFDDRTRRVLELRRLVREGRYRPDPREVAEAMLGEWIALTRTVNDEDVPTTASARWARGRFIVAPTPAASDEAAQIA